MKERKEGHQLGEEEKGTFDNRVAKLKNLKEEKLQRKKKLHSTTGLPGPKKLKRKKSYIQHSRVARSKKLKRKKSYIRQ